MRIQLCPFKAAPKEEEDAGYLFSNNFFDTFNVLTQTSTVSHTPASNNLDIDSNANEWIIKEDEP